MQIQNPGTAKIRIQCRSESETLMPGPRFVLDGSLFECPVAPFILDGKDCCWPTGAALWEAVDGLLEEGLVMAAQLRRLEEGERIEERETRTG